MNKQRHCYSGLSLALVLMAACSQAPAPTAFREYVRTHHFSSEAFLESFNDQFEFLPMNSTLSIGAGPETEGTDIARTVLKHNFSRCGQSLANIVIHLDVVMKIADHNEIEGLEDYDFPGAHQDAVLPVGLQVSASQAICDPDFRIIIVVGYSSPDLFKPNAKIPVGTDWGGISATAYLLSGRGDEPAVSITGAPGDMRFTADLMAFYDAPLIPRASTGPKEGLIVGSHGYSFSHSDTSGDYRPAWPPASYGSSIAQTNSFAYSIAIDSERVWEETGEPWHVTHERSFPGEERHSVTSDGDCW